jgi:hypothetical protein
MLTPLLALLAVLSLLFAAYMAGRAGVNLPPRRFRARVVSPGTVEPDVAAELQLREETLSHATNALYEGLRAEGIPVSRSDARAEAERLLSQAFYGGGAV